EDLKIAVLLRSLGFRRVGLLLASPALRRHGLGFQRGAEGNAVEPVGDILSWPDGGGLAGEYEKSGLQGVFGIVVVMEDAAANPEDHRGMAPHKSVEGGLVLALDEAREEATIRHACVVLPEQGAAQMPEDGVDRSGRHACPPWRSFRFSLVIARER